MVTDQIEELRTEHTSAMFEKINEMIRAINSDVEDLGEPLETMVETNPAPDGMEIVSKLNDVIRHVRGDR